MPDKNTTWQLSLQRTRDLAAEQGRARIGHARRSAGNESLCRLQWLTPLADELAANEPAVIVAFPGAAGSPTTEACHVAQAAARQVSTLGRIPELQEP